MWASPSAVLGARLFSSPPSYLLFHVENIQRDRQLMRFVFVILCVRDTKFSRQILFVRQKKTRPRRVSSATPESLPTFGALFCDRAVGRHWPHQ